MHNDSTKDKKTLQSMKQSFDQIAQQYDSQRQRLIPCFDAFYGTAVELASTYPSSNLSPPRILDLGAGTGLLSAYMLQVFPGAELTLIDLSEEMLSKAKERLSVQSNVQYEIADYTRHDMNDSYDLIVSGLSIHHLADDEKQQLFHSIYHNLKPGGLFINADQVLGHTERIEALYKTDWQTKVESSDLSRKAIQASYDRCKFDRMATLHNQLQWLSNSGLEDVDCVFKSYNFVVIQAWKPQ